MIVVGEARKGIENLDGILVVGVNGDPGMGLGSSRDVLKGTKDAESFEVKNGGSGGSSGCRRAET